GIGKAIAEKFLKKGFNLSVCARNEKELIALASEWSTQYPDAAIVFMPIDLSAGEGVAEFAAFTLSRLKRIDVLVNNAGAYKPGNLHSEPEGLLENLMATNLYSAYRLTRALLPPMMEAKDGHIFNISSVAGLKAYTGGGAYSITKYAMEGFSVNLREELRPYNIRVSNICPGATYTRSWQGAGLPETRLMKSSDIASLLWTMYKIGRTGVVEHVVMRPPLGDI
ncbi:MAG: SDR family oxidoreductase, partial [Chitinophagia bacterium]|nr:SDR family oxidoreductase [Chitinophagia bacterium]